MLAVSAKKSAILVGVTIAAAIVASVAKSQPSTVERDTQTEPAAVTDIAEPGASAVEQLTVRGVRLGRLRAQLERAQENLYSMFNETINDPDFEIRCERETPTGSSISLRVCRTAYAREALSLHGRLAQRGIALDTEAEIAGKDRELALRMVESIEANPELREALLNYENLRDAFLEASEDRFDR